MPFNRAECLVIVWGNVREVVSEKGEAKQVNAYYPFGTPIHTLDANECRRWSACIKKTFEDVRDDYEKIY